jgi:hypothetical protein
MAKSGNFCTKCKCRATGTVGVYQLSHWDSEHVDNYRRPGSTTAATPASSRDTSEAPPEVPDAASSTAPQIANPNPIPPGPPDVAVRQDEFADEAHDLDEIEFTGMWCASVDDDTPAHALMFQVQLYCTMVDCPVDANATITISAPSVFEREIVDDFDELLVETVVEDKDELDDQDDTDDEDDFTVIDMMFPDPDRDDEDTDFVDYPSTDDDSDDETYFDDEDIYNDAAADASVDWWSCLSPSVRYDLEHPPIEDEFYDAYEVEPIVTIYKGSEFFDAMEPPLDVVPFCPSLPWYHWIKLGSFWASTLFWDTIVYFVSAPPPVLRRVRRRRLPITVPGYPRTWMLFTSCLMVGMDAFRGHAPPFPFLKPITMIQESLIR